MPNKLLKDMINPKIISDSAGNTYVIDWQGPGKNPSPEERAALIKQKREERIAAQTKIAEEQRRLPLAAKAVSTPPWSNIIGATETLLGGVREAVGRFGLPQEQQARRVQPRAPVEVQAPIVQPRAQAAVAPTVPGLGGQPLPGIPPAPLPWQLDPNVSSMLTWPERYAGQIPSGLLKVGESFRSMGAAPTAAEPYPAIRGGIGMLHGGMEAISPVIPAAIAARPLHVLGGLATYALAQPTAEIALTKLGMHPTLAEAFSEVAGFAAAGGLSRKIPTRFSRDVVRLNNKALEIQSKISDPAQAENLPALRAQLADVIREGQRLAAQYKPTQFGEPRTAPVAPTKPPKAPPGPVAPAPPVGPPKPVAPPPPAPSLVVPSPKPVIEPGAAPPTPSAVTQPLVSGAKLPAPPPTPAPAVEGVAAATLRRLAERKRGKEVKAEPKEVVEPPLPPPPPVEPKAAPPSKVALPVTEVIKERAIEEAKPQVSATPKVEGVWSEPRTGARVFKHTAPDGDVTFTAEIKGDRRGPFKTQEEAVRSASEQKVSAAQRALVRAKEKKGEVAVEAPKEIEAPKVEVVPEHKVGDHVLGKAGAYDVTAVAPDKITYTFTNKAGKATTASMSPTEFSRLKERSEGLQEAKPSREVPTVESIPEQLKLLERKQIELRNADDPEGVQMIQNRINQLKKQVQKGAPVRPPVSGLPKVGKPGERGAVPGEILRGIAKRAGLLKEEAPQAMLERISRMELPEVPGAKPPTRENPIEIVTQALKEAGRIREEMGLLWTKEKGVRIARAEAVKARGRKGFYQELGHLKGELPKLQFESIAKRVKPKHIDALFTMIRDTPNLTHWEKISARTGLAKLFGEYGGAIPQPSERALLERAFASPGSPGAAPRTRLLRVFPPGEPGTPASQAKAAREFIKALEGKQPLFTRMKSLGLELANVPRSLMASYDLSAPLRQGFFMIGRPKQFVPAFGEMFKEFVRPKEFQAVQDSIRHGPYYDLMEKSNLAITELASDLGKREEMFMSPIAERIPVIGAGVRISSRAYVGFLNKLRADVFVDLIKKAARQGLKPEENLGLSKAIADYVNTATGRGSLTAGLERAAPALNAFFFSPRLMASRIKLLNPLYYTKQSAFVRKEALRDLFSATGVVLTMLGLAKLAGADVGSDPRAADFAKIKVGNTRLDIAAGFLQYIRLAAQFMSGQTVTSTGKITTLGEGYKPETRLSVLGRFVTTKESPVASFATDMLRGRTMLGEEISIPKEIGKRFVPMVIQDFYDIAKDDPELLPLAIPGIFGVGLQTYAPPPTVRPPKKPKGPQKPVRPSRP